MKLLESLNFTLIETHEGRSHSWAWGGCRGLFLITSSAPASRNWFIDFTQTASLKMQPSGLQEQFYLSICLSAYLLVYLSSHLTNLGETNKLLTAAWLINAACLSVLEQTLILHVYLLTYSMSAAYERIATCGFPTNWISWVYLLCGIAVVKDNWSDPFA